MTITLPPLSPIPDDISDHIYRLLHGPHDPAIGPWLLELAKNSGHLSNPEELRWRALCLVWLAMEYNADAAWPYLMWLNMNEPAISEHLSEILVEAVDEFETHVQVANWQAQADDERLVTFLKEFRCIPARRRIQPLMSKRLADPTRPETGVWLAAFCRDTAYNDAAFLRSWRLLAAAWYAAAFDPAQGVSYLQALTNNAASLSAADNQLLMDAATGANGLAAMIQVIADCPDSAVKTMLKDFGHPDLPALAKSILESEPDYAYLKGVSQNALGQVEFFNFSRECLEQAGIVPKNSHILDLACGPLAEYAHLFDAAGYNVLGVDLNIPPGYLPLPGLTGWFKRRKHAKAWKLASSPNYHALEQQAGVSLRRGKVKVQLADLTRLELAGNTFDAVICADYLHHAPNVTGLLAEAARVLKPGGLFVANIRPYAGLGGAFQAESSAPWSHVHRTETSPIVLQPLNKWRETQFQNALNGYFTVEQWLPSTDLQAQAKLTPEIEAELADYSAEELTRKQILVVAQKPERP